MDKKNCDVLVVGGGPAGLTAALYAARAGFKTIVLEKMGAGGQIMLTPDIENFPGFLTVGGAELGAKMLEQAEHAGAEVIYDEIESLDLDKKIFYCTACEINCRSVIIATGAEPRKLDVDGEERLTGTGVHYCAICDGAFYKGKNVLVVGGGNSAVEEAIFMSEIAKNITLVNVTPDFNAQAVLVEKLNSLKIPFHHETVVKNIIGKDKVTAAEICNVNTNKCQLLSVDAVFIAIGRVPSTMQFAGQIELTNNGYITVDKNLCTSVLGVYAAGDVIDKSVRQVVTACADGAIAATHAAEWLRTGE